MDFRSESVMLGFAFAEPKFGIQFKIFSLSYSENDPSSFWLESLSSKHNNESTTEFCLTDITTLGELNQKDFSECFVRKSFSDSP